MGQAEIHRQEGYQWSVDDAGTLTLDKTDDDEGKIRLDPIWEEYRRFNSMTDGYDTGHGIVGYRQPWFEYRDQIVQVRVGDGVTEIPNGAFESAENLRAVSLPVGLKCIGNRAFAFCKSLTDIALPDGLKSIGAEAFLSCKSLTSVALPDSLYSIGAEAFAFCDSLTRLCVPAGVVIIGKEALEAGTLLEATLPIKYKDDKSIFRFTFPSRPQFNPRLLIRYAKPPKAPEPGKDGSRPAQSLFARLFGKG